MEWIKAERVPPGLGSTDVHVWRFRLDAPREPVLTADEQQRAAGMSSSNSRDSFTASQSALRLLLAAYTSKDPRELAIVRGIHGKPALANGDCVEFNVSHSGEWGLVAVARVAVGVDVEQVRQRGINPNLKERFLTPAERALVEVKTNEHGDAAFFIVWSRKEAYLKATGLGLAAPFSSVDSSADELPDLNDAGVANAQEKPWSVREFFVDERHPAALVARVRAPSPTFLTLWSGDQ